MLKILEFQKIPNLRSFILKLEQSSLVKRLACGALWSLAGTVFLRGLNFLYLVVAGRVLGVEAFGSLGIVQNTIGMLGVLAGFGMGLTATKFVAEFRESNPEKAGSVISLTLLISQTVGLVMVVILLLSANWLAENTLASPQIAPLLKFGSAMLFFGAVNGTQIGALAGFEAFKSIAKVNFFAGALALPVFLFCLKTDGVRGAVVGLVVASGINCCFGNYYIRNEIKRLGINLNFKRCFSEWKVIWEFGLPSVLAGILYSPVIWACGAILVNQDDGYRQMGLYNSAYQVGAVILFLSVGVGPIVVPIITNMISSQDGIRARKVFKLNLFAIALVSFILACIISFFSSGILNLYGDDFKNADNILVIVSFVFFLMSLNSILGFGLASNGKMWVGFLFNLLWGFFSILFCVYFVPRYGAMGLSLSLLLSYGIHTFLQVTYIFKYLFRG